MSLWFFFLADRRSLLDIGLPHVLAKQAASCCSRQDLRLLPDKINEPQKNLKHHNLKSKFDKSNNCCFSVVQENNYLEV